MNPPNLSELTEQALIEKERKSKKGGTVHAFMIGLMVGVVIYSLVKNGLVWPTFFPFILIAVLEKRRRDEQKALQQEIESRKNK